MLPEQSSIVLKAMQRLSWSNMPAAVDSYSHAIAADERNYVYQSNRALAYLKMKNLKRQKLIAMLHLSCAMAVLLVSKRF